MNVHEDPLQLAVAEVMASDFNSSEIESDLVTGIDDLNASADEIGEISRTVNIQGDVADSLESFNRDFMERVPEGEWDRRTAVQYRLGVGAIMRAHGIKLDLNEISASSEAAGVTQSNDDNRKESDTKTKGIVSRLIEALMAALKSLGESIKRFATGIINNSLVLRKAGEQLSKAVAATKGDIPKGNFEAKPAWGTYYHMKENGGDPSAAKIVNNVGMELNSLLGGWDQSFKTLVTQLSHLDYSESERHGGGVTKINVSGGITLECQYLDSQLKGAGANLLKAEIKVVRASQPAGPIPYLDKHEIAEVASGMIRNADFMKTMSESSKPILEELKKLLEQLKKRTGDAKDVYKRSQKSDAAGAVVQKGNEQISAVRKLVSKYPIATKILTPQVAAVSLNAWRHAMASLSRSGKSGGGTNNTSKANISDATPGSFAGRLPDVVKRDIANGDVKSVRAWLISNIGHKERPGLFRDSSTVSDYLPDLYEKGGDTSIEKDSDKWDATYLHGVKAALAKNFSKKLLHHVVDVQYHLDDPAKK